MDDPQADQNLSNFPDIGCIIQSRIYDLVKQLVEIFAKQIDRFLRLAIFTKKAPS